MSILGTLAIKGATSLGKYVLGKAFGPKRRKFKNTAYGKRLKEISKEGAIPQAQKNMIMGNIGRRAGNQTSKAVAGYRGRLASLGAGDSIASAGRIGSMESKAAEQVGRASERLDVKNALSKKHAKDEYARAKTQYSEQQDQIQDSYQQRLKSGLVGDVVDAAGGAYSAHRMKKSLENSDVDFSDPKQALQWSIDQADPGQAMQQLRQAGYASRYHDQDGLDQDFLLPLLQGKSKDDISRILKSFMANGMLKEDFLNNFKK